MLSMHVFEFRLCVLGFYLLSYCVFAGGKDIVL